MEYPDVTTELNIFCNRHPNFSRTIESNPPFDVISHYPIESRLA
jgi:hypothetical protein